ncbi:hypothetical protein PUN28_020259 [Cardiocondyla obscurior]|uniref:Uncharacterized protein n=1 Tax=Cardiocondyla obscurior TaxID=286306 RepID=A0AAW2E5X5_9HYME
MSRHPCVVARFSYRIRRFETIGSIVDYLASAIVRTAGFKELEKDSTGLKELEKDSAAFKELEKDSAGFKELEKDSAGFKELEKDSTGLKELEKDSAGFKELEKDSAGFKELEKDSAKFKELEKDSAGNVSYHGRVSFAAWCKHKDQPDIPRTSRGHPERRRRPRKGILPRRSNPRIKRNSAASHRLMRT